MHATCLAAAIATAVFVWTPGGARSASLAGVVPPLAAKVREIAKHCGSRVISGRRHTAIGGSSRLSLHAYGKAVDMEGNPRCIYARLRHWPGGVSTDYSRVRHVHISYDTKGRREWGLRFSHGGGRSRGNRYAAWGIPPWMAGQM